MKPSRLRLGLLALLGAPALANCPPDRPQLLLERFVSADCEACWAAVPPHPDPGRTAFALDWIVPGAEQAPLAAAALDDSTARAARAGALRADEALTQGHPLPGRSALALEVRTGPGWNGYIGLQLTVRFTSLRPLPSGLSGWLALVERIPAGDEGTPVDRQLVRTVVGPLTLDGLARQPVRHLRSVRVPESGKAERLAAVGWVETDKGRVIAVGRSSTPDCP